MGMQLNTITTEAKVTKTETSQFEIEKCNLPGDMRIIANVTK